MKKFISLVIMVSWIIFLSMPACRKDSPAVQPPFTPNENKPPVAMAGAPQHITLSTCKSVDGEVELDGTASTDPDGVIKDFDWTILSSYIIGPGTPRLINASSSKAGLKGLAVGQYIIQLTVTDDKGLAAKDTVSIFVNGKPDEFDLDIAFTVPYQQADSLVDCPWDPGICDTFRTISTEAKIQHPALGPLTMLFSEHILTGNKQAIKSVLHFYTGNLNNQFASGRTDLKFYEAILNNQKEYKGNITITHGSAFDCDLYYYKNNKIKLNLSARADTLAKTVFFHLSGKLYF